MQRTSPRDDNCFNELAKDLISLSSDNSLIYIPNPGNWGDALIAAGTRKFFRENKIKYKELNLYQAQKWSRLNIRLKTRSLNPSLVYGGGGAFVEIYKRYNQFKSIVRKFQSTVVLPTTYAIKMQPADFGRKTVFYRRDNSESKDFVESSKFCHDLAFYLDTPDVTVKHRDGIFFREDRETPSFGAPSNNTDLSSQGLHTSNIDEFFQLVGTFENIYTNRLHVAIAGSMLRRNVHLFPNSYFKNKAIFNSSIEPYFPKSHFHDCSPQEYGLK